MGVFSFQKFLLFFRFLVQTQEKKSKKKSRRKKARGLSKNRAKVTWYGAQIQLQQQSLSMTQLTLRSTVQAFLDFRCFDFNNFQFNKVYNSILLEIKESTIRDMEAERYKDK